MNFNENDIKTICNSCFPNYIDKIPCKHCNMSQLKQLKANLVKWKLDNQKQFESLNELRELLDKYLYFKTK